MNETSKHCVFQSDFEKMPFKERDVRKMIAEVKATSWRLRVATHRLERMRRLRMLEEQGAWKREAGYNGNEIIAEMDA